MFNRKKKEQTPGAKANRAQSNIFVRLIGCALLVYIMVDLIRSDEFNTGEFWKVAIAVLLGLAALFIIVLTVREFIRNFREGAYSPKFYAEKEESEGEAKENNNSGDPPAAE